MPAVQRGGSSGARRAAAWVLSGLAGLLVLAALNSPRRVEDLEAAAFVRLPLEALVFLALVVAVPPRFVRLRTAMAATGGLLLGLTAVFKVLDLGFLQALNRPFDPLIDWRYTRSLVELVRDSFGTGPGTLMLVAALLAVVALLVLLPLAVLRLARLAARHRRPVVPALAAVIAVWLALALLDVRGVGGTLASRDTAAYVYGQVSRIPSELRDQREFARAAELDPYRDVAPDDLLTGLRGKDVLFVFVESLGRVAVEGSTFSPGIVQVLDNGTRRLARAGFRSRSAFMTSPTFGALSWLAHATLQSGLWVDSQQRYDVLMTSPRLTLSHLFGRAGWRTVATIPANTRDWPQGDYYDFDKIYDSRNVGYRGPRFGYPTMPDQYTLQTFHRLELQPRDRPPVMAEIDLITSHAPWSRTPWMIDPDDVGDGSVYEGMPEQLPSEGDIWPEPERVRAAYGHAIEYSLRAFVSFVTTFGDDDLVVVVMGDHQPATIVSGEEAGHDVPVAVVTRDRAVLEQVSAWGWGPGLLPEPDAPVWRMDAFRDRFLATFGGTRDTGDDPAGTP